MVCHQRGCTALALGLVMMLAPLRVARAEDHAARYIAAAERLYESLEYERALAQFAQARRLPRTLAEDVRIALFEGMILSDMGMHDEARIAFKSGLLLDPTAKLPVRTSPQVELEFEGIRGRVREELAVQEGKQKNETVVEALPATPEDASATDHPEAPTALLTPPEKPDTRPSWLTSSVRMGSVSVPTPTLALVGAGAVAGGVGGFFGVQSRDRLQTARDATFRDEMVARHGEAVASARTANILFGTAAVLTTSALVTWLLSESAEGAHAEADQ
jgi:tetratricopeptide (TPR) repeat protein